MLQLGLFELQSMTVIMLLTNFFIDSWDLFEDIAWLSVNAFVFLPSLVLKVSLLAHANDDDKEDRDEGGKWAIRTNSRYRLHNRIECVEAHDDLFKLKEEGDGNEGQRTVASRLDLIVGRHLLL